MRGRCSVDWGHSQGGYAALFAGLMAARYAPQLQLAGVAVAAPATDPGLLMQRDANTGGGRNIAATTLWSWSRVYALALEPALRPAALSTVDALAGECIESLYDVLRRQSMGRSLATVFLQVGELARRQLCRDLLALNTPRALPLRVPLNLVQGAANTLVEPAITMAYAWHQCVTGGAVEMMLQPDVGHGFAARDGAPTAVDWMMDCLAGRAAPPSSARACLWGTTGSRCSHESPPSRRGGGERLACCPSWGTCKERGAMF